MRMISDLESGRFGMRRIWNMPKNKFLSYQQLPTYQLSKYLTCHSFFKVWSLLDLRVLGGENFNSDGAVLFLLC